MLRLKPTTISVTTAEVEDFERQCHFRQYLNDGDGESHSPGRTRLGFQHRHRDADRPGRSLPLADGNSPSGLSPGNTSGDGCVGETSVFDIQSDVEEGGLLTCVRPANLANHTLHRDTSSQDRIGAASSARQSPMPSTESQSETLVLQMDSGMSTVPTGHQWRTNDDSSGSPEIHVKEKLHSQTAGETPSLALPPPFSIARRSVSRASPSPVSDLVVNK